MNNSKSDVNQLAIKIQIADWTNPEDQKKLLSIRRQIFIEEQGVPEALEWDEHDSTATHYLASLSDTVVACARLKSDGQIGRMAVFPDYRNQGIGSTLLQFILNNLNPDIFSLLYLHAQTTAISFYEKQGFVRQGEIFYEADIPHVEMLKKLNI